MSSFVSLYLWSLVWSTGLVVVSIKSSQWQCTSWRRKILVPLLNLQRWLAWISSSILTFKVEHSLVEWQKFQCYLHCLLGMTFKGVGMSSALRSSSKILARSAFNDIYWANLIPWCSLGHVMGWPQHHHGLDFLLKSRNSSSCINFAARLYSSSRPATSFLHNSSVNGLNLRVVTIWCKDTSELRLQMFKATFLSLSMKSLNDSPFS